MRRLSKIGITLALLTPLAGQAVAANCGRWLRDWPNRLKQIDLTFSEDINIARSTITVTGPRGSVRTTLAQYPRQKSIVLVSLWNTLGPGKYRVNWRVGTAGKGMGHAVLTFTVK